MRDVSEIELAGLRANDAILNHLGVNFNSLLAGGVFGDTVLVPLSVRT